MAILMSGQEKLSVIAFVVSTCVIIGLVICFTTLFVLYSYYKRKHIKLGEENEILKKELKHKYKDVARARALATSTNDASLETKEDINKQKTKGFNDTNTSYYNSLLRDKNKKKRIAIITNTFLGIVYSFLFVIFVFALTFRLSNEQFFFNDTALLAIKTSSMETVHKDNTYIEENKLSNQFKQYSLISIDKVKSEEDIELYDIVAFKNSKGHIIVHRVIKIGFDEKNNSTYYTLRGDANKSSLLEETHLSFDKVIGKYNGFHNYGLGILIIYLQSNIGLIAVASSFIFLIAYNISEEKIEKSYDKQFIEVSKVLDEYDFINTTLINSNEEINDENKE